MNSRPTRLERWNYWFDNFMSRGTLALIGGLGLVSLLIIFVSAVVVTLGGTALGPSEVEAVGFIEAAWMALMRTLDAGTMGGDVGWGFRIVMFAVTLGGVFIISTLIGILTAGVDAKLESMRKGRSRVLESNHTVILGWSPQIFTIVKELISANENIKRSVIAILADKDKVEMEDAIKDRIGATGNTKVICRSGEPIDPNALSIISPQQAKSIIILPPEDIDADSYVIKSTLAVTNSPNRRTEPYNIVTQIVDARNLALLNMIGAKDNIRTILTKDIIARVTAQTSRQLGLSIVYTELLSFGGDEIYFKPEPKFAGRLFAEVLNAYNDSSVIGLRKSNGQTLLNPPIDTIINTDDEIIALSADDDSIILSGLATVPVQHDLLRTNTIREPARPEKCLILGWNDSAETIVKELESYVQTGSRVTVAANSLYRESVYNFKGLKNQQLSFQEGDTTDRSFLNELNIADYDHVIVLADTTLQIQYSDARTLVTLLHLRDIAEKDETPFSIVSEMLDVRNRELAEVTKVDDFIVSDHLISLMMAQLSENGALKNVFADLFDPEGSELYLKPVREYVEIGQPVNFYTVVEAAKYRGEIAIGYRILTHHYNADKAYGIVTNPNKSDLVTFSLNDKIIVLAE